MKIRPKIAKLSDVYINTSMHIFVSNYIKVNAITMIFVRVLNLII